MTAFARRAAGAGGGDRRGRAAGRIDLCPKNACAYRCCDFQRGNYIVLFPGELEEAAARGDSVGHLRITAREWGGYRAVCEARDTSTCDGGHKPLDCQSYPFFPTLRPDRDEVGMMSKGRKCPLESAEISGHQDWVRATWNRLICSHEQVGQWLRKVTLVGYDPPVEGAAGRRVRVPGSGVAGR
jgi:hypothetical protein